MTYNVLMGMLNLTHWPELGINGEGELRGQLANPGSPEGMAVKTKCMCVPVSYLQNLNIIVIVSNLPR